MDDFEKSGEQVFEKQITNVSFGESCRLEYKISNNQNRPLNIPSKKSQKLQDKYDRAIQQIERDIILSDESRDKAVSFMAMTGFKKKEDIN